MKTIMEGFVIFLVMAYFVTILNILGVTIANAEYDPFSPYYCCQSDDGVYYCQLTDLKRYLKENGWVDGRVTDEQLEYELLLCQQLSITTKYVSPALAIAMVAQESKFYPDCEYEGAIGLMQLLPKYHQHRLNDICEEPTFDKWYDSRLNIQCGLWYMDELMSDEYACGDTTYALMMYNQGPTSASKTYLGSNIVSDYASNIIMLKNEIEEILEKGEYYCGTPS